MTLGTGRQTTMSARRRRSTNVAAQRPSIQLPSNLPLNLLLPALVGFIITLALAFWGGNPQPGTELVFIAGVVLVTVGIAFFALVSWHFLIRPLPAGHASVARSFLSVSQRRLIATLIVLSTINLVVGGMWDEVWHRAYGAALGEDLLWMPHIMIYTMLGFNVLVAFGGLFYLLRYGKGTLQQRFRSDFLIGVLILVSTYMLFAVPADPVWHTLYGDDISGLSIPHLVLGFGMISTLLVAPALLLSTYRTRAWGGIHNLTAQDLPMIIAFTCMMNFLLQLLTTDWYAASAEGVPPFLLLRPDWLLPALLLGIATFAGVLATHALRRWGVATIMGFTALIMRAGVFLLLDNDPNANMLSWVVVLIPLIAVDAVYALSIQLRKRPPTRVDLTIAASFGMMAALPLVNQLFAYPNTNTANLLPTLVAILLVSGGAVWFGTVLGTYMATANKQLEDAPRAVAVAVAAPRASVLRLLPPLAVLGLLALIIFLVRTTPPPV